MLGASRVLGRLRVPPKAHVSGCHRRPWGGRKGDCGPGHSERISGALAVTAPAGVDSPPTAQTSLCYWGHGWGTRWGSLIQRTWGDSQFETGLVGRQDAGGRVNDGKRQVCLGRDDLRLGPPEADPETRTQGKRFSKGVGRRDWEWEEDRPRCHLRPNPLTMPGSLE